MVMNLVRRVKQAINTGVQALRQHIAASLKPTNSALMRGSLHDLIRTRPQLMAENAGRGEGWGAWVANGCGEQTKSRPPCTW